MDVQPGPGPQSLSPFESRATSMAVFGSVLVVSSLVLTICWVLWS